MKRIMLLCMVAVFAVSSAAFAADFAPTLLKLSADPVIQYDFDGSSLEIPVQVTGTPAGIVFSVYTRDKAAEVPNMVNGFLGWHHVNKVDTCVFYSTLKSFEVGNQTLSWDGRDQDGGIVPAGEYTYYMWAYDNQGTKTLAASHGYSENNSFVSVDTAGMPLANPIFKRATDRWYIGNDPLDSTLLETCTYSLTEGWARCMEICFDPSNFDYYYMQVWNKEATTSGLQKFKWVPGGEAELQTDFGEDGLSELFSVDGSAQNPGVVTDGEFLYTVWRTRDQTEPGNAFYIYDYDGYIYNSVDLSPWWANKDDLDAGAQMNGGPNDLHIRNGNIFLDCHCSCLMQMCDPARFIETEVEEDFFVWTNDNGDYVGDHNFEETAAVPWACMDYNVGPYTYTINADQNLHMIFNAYDVGAVTFGLCGPDGTGFGYFAFAGETAGWKRAEAYIDDDTAFDGLYCDNMQTGGTHYEWDSDKADGQMYFLGHDSISGVITNAVAVADDAPAAFSVDQNAPNPFNPTTTITFSLANAGDVTVDVFNVAGQRVDTLADGFMDAGRHSVTWDASGFSAGVYFYTVKSAGFSRTMKMTLVK